MSITSTLIILLLIFILLLAIVYLLKSFINSSLSANEAILAEMREIKKLLKKED